MKAREYRLMCQIAADSWSGNHLLRPRSRGYWHLSKEMHKALNAKTMSNRQKELIEAYISVGGDSNRFI